MISEICTRKWEITCREFCCRWYRHSCRRCLDDAVGLRRGIRRFRNFKSGDPAKRARAIVQAVTYYNDPVKLAELSENLGEAMSGLEIKTLENKYAERCW